MVGCSSGGLSPPLPLPLPLAASLLDALLFLAVCFLPSSALSATPLP